MKDPLLLRNLLVDSYNFGILKLVMRPFDTGNANSMWNRGEGERFRAAIRRIDRAAAKAGHYDWQTLLEGMAPFYKDQQGRERDVSLSGLYHAGNTVEFRTFDAQRDSKEGYLQAKLLRHCLEGLSAVGKPVPVAERRSVDAWYKSVATAGNFNYSLVEKKWKGFVEKLGVSYKDYAPFMARWNLNAKPQAKPDPTKNIRAFFEEQML